MARTVRALAAELRQRREELHLTQARLAELAEVSREYIVRLESGKSRSELGSVMRVARALGCELTLADAPYHVDSETPSPFDEPWEEQDA